MFIPKIPENNLKFQLEDLVNIAQKLEKIKKYEFNNPTNDEELKILETRLDFIFPDEYKDFLRFSNGLILNGSTAEFFSIEEIIKFYEKKKATDFPSDYIVIAFLIGDGEVLCVSSETGKFIRYFDGEEEFFDTFKDVLENIIQHIKTIEEDYLLED